MSEPISENPNQAAQPGAEDTGTSGQSSQPQPQAQAQSSDSGEQSFPLRLVKRPTGDVHWNTARGVWETITHAETGEPSAEYVLLATIDGVDVPLASYNAGRLETVVRSQQQSG